MLLALMTPVLHKKYHGDVPITGAIFFDMRFEGIETIGVRVKTKCTTLAQIV